MPDKNAIVRTDPQQIAEYVPDQGADAQLAVVQLHVTKLTKKFKKLKKQSKAASEELEALRTERDTLREEHNALAQHALNVVVAFQMHAIGQRVVLGNGMFADDAETSASVASIIQASRDLHCQGTELLPAQASEPRGNMADCVTESGESFFGGGIFSR